MKSLIDIITEANIEPKPAVTTFYRANIGKNFNTGSFTVTEYRIGDVTELTYKYYSNFDKAFVFGEPSGKSWSWAMEIKSIDNSSESNFKKFLIKLNKEDKFYQYFINKSDAIKAADKAKKEYEKQKWTLKTLLSAIKKDKDLMSLGYDYHIAKVTSQVENLPIESIYVNGLWKINVVDNKILVKRAGWSTYEVPNLASLYKVLSANSGSDKDETTRQRYSIMVNGG